MIADCRPCVPQLMPLTDRVRTLRSAIASEPEPVVVLTRLLRMCRDEHRMLWEYLSDAVGRSFLAARSDVLRPILRGTGAYFSPAQQQALADALDEAEPLRSVVTAHALAVLIDETCGHTFSSFFRKSSPYQPSAGDPVLLSHPDLKEMMSRALTTPPWRLANRLDETRHVRLAGGWVNQFRVVFDYSLFDVLSGLVTAETVIATCHPNQCLDDFNIPLAAKGPVFPIAPIDLTRQYQILDRLIGQAVDAGASIVVLPELCVTESLAHQLERWVRRDHGLRVLVAGSYHHRAGSAEQRNTALTWVRGRDHPLIHEKFSPADKPVIEGIHADGCPEIRVYVTSDGWHVAVMICRDLLNPHAVHALSEAGVNLVLVPAMSETLLSFGGPSANLVGSEQALVAVANNPSVWSATGRTPARALFGHPCYPQQTIAIAPALPGSGVATLHIGTGKTAWQPDLAAGSESALVSLTDRR